MPTNLEHLQTLSKELEQIKQRIQSSGREDELKSLSKSLNLGENQHRVITLGTFELHPEQEDLLCHYYIQLFAEFQAMKSEEWTAKKAGAGQLKLWEHTEFQRTDKFADSSKKLLKSVAEKIAVSGIMAALVWLGTTAVSHLHFKQTSGAEEEDTSAQEANETSD